MFYGAKGGCIDFPDTDMDYVSFGRGQKNLVMIPGIGDGFKTVRGMAIPLALMYRRYAARYKVYVFSRKNQLAEGCSTRDMAEDQKEAMKALKISRAHIFGISQGGMIAQYLAVDYPDLVEKLVLAVTASRPNETLRAVVGRWIRLAEANDYGSLVVDSVEKSYTEAYIKRKKYRMMYPLLRRIGKPKSLGRFLIHADACLNHNAYDELDKITCPTLVIGGDSDRVAGGESSAETAAKIRNSTLLIYKGLGHGAYEEAKDFNRKVLSFLGLA